MNWSRPPNASPVQAEARFEGPQHVVTRRPSALDDVDGEPAFRSSPCTWWTCRDPVWPQSVSMTGVEARRVRTVAWRASLAAERPRSTRRWRCVRCTGICTGAADRVARGVPRWCSHRESSAAVLHLSRASLRAPAPQGRPAAIAAGRTRLQPGSLLRPPRRWTRFALNSEPMAVAVSRYFCGCLPAMRPERTSCSSARTAGNDSCRTVRVARSLTPSAPTHSLRFDLPARNALEPLDGGCPALKAPGLAGFR